MAIYSSYGFSDYNTIQSKVTTLTLLALDVSVTIFAIITYAYFFSRVKIIHRRESGTNVSATGRDILVMKKFKVPFLMVLTYILCNVSGTVCVVTIYYKSGIIGYLLYNILTISGFLTDAFIYVYLQKNVWEFFLKMIGKNNRGNITTVDRPSVITQQTI